MAFYGNDVGIIPLTDAAGITQEFKAGKHYGIDIGWSTVANKPYCDVLAWQAGVVVGKGYYSDTGYWVALKHSYSNNKYRWSCYIHLKEQACVSVGQQVAFAQKIGIRGSSGHSTAPHLHFYLTKEMGAKLTFSFANMKPNCINPVPYLYYDKKFNTLYISANSWKKPLPAPIDEVVQPVARDQFKDQLICHEDGLRVRTTPSINGEKIGHIEKDKYYNYFEIKEADNYKWYKIKDNQWVAGIESLEILPKIAVVEPVERDAEKDQLICSVDNLRVRTDASLQGTRIGFLQANKYYNYFETKEADGYLWLKLADNQWCAKVEEVTLLPKIIYHTVVEGDTLENIAKEYNITLEQLIKLNPQLAVVGNQLRIR